MEAEHLDVGKDFVWGHRKKYEICVGKWKTVLIRESEYPRALGLVIVNAKTS